MRQPLAGPAPDRGGAQIAGVGIGLRSPHIGEILETRPPLPWLELLADNHLAAGGLIPRQTEALAEHYPTTLHCVGMSLGSSDPLDPDYLARIKGLSERLQPAWISDHLCFTSQGGHHYHDLLPLPYTEEALDHLSGRIDQVQETLGRPFLVENVSSYLSYSASSLNEAEFLAELCRRCGCGLLLDVNNIYVSACNHGFDALDYLEQIPLERVQEVHLAGYEQRDGYLLDAHSRRVSQPVWALYRELMRRAPGVPTLIEWDKDIPPLGVLLDEAARAAAIAAECASPQAVSA